MAEKTKKDIKTKENLKTKEDKEDIDEKSKSKTKKRFLKKKIRKNIPSAIAHVNATFNNTVINIGSLDALVQELNKLDRVYGIVILLCITYIVVRFLGMFNIL